MELGPWKIIMWPIMASYALCAHYARDVNMHDEAYQLLDWSI